MLDGIYYRVIDFYSPACGSLLWPITQSILSYLIMPDKKDG